MTRLELPGYDVVGVRASNPGPFTLSGTNSWIVEREPAWLIDPGPSLPDHIQALRSELERRGGLGGIALTHDHSDHAEGVRAIRALFPEATLAGARGEVDNNLVEGSTFGPLTAVQTPRHASDHIAFVSGPIGFSGDAVLGEGSVFIAPDPGALTGYLDALERLKQLDLRGLGPGHGPPVLEVRAKLEQYIAHRREREQRLLRALAAGRRTVSELLDDAWADAPEALRPAATLTLAAHLDKLADEGRLPPDVQRPQVWR